MTRKLATIRLIDEILPIPNADNIECAVLGGWKVVIKKGQFKSGEKVIYIEIDSWVPHEIAPFLTKGEPNEYKGVVGNRLRTVKLRGQISQGLVLPLSILSSEELEKVYLNPYELEEILNIRKFEPPISAQLAGDIKGVFPGFIPKTDQERIQNLAEEFEIWKECATSWEVSEKLDGCSMTVFFNQGENGVCSRNYEMKETDSNTFWKVTKRDQLIEKIKSTNRMLALQGELIGPGIQGNKYKLSDHKFRVFDIFDIESQEYLTSGERLELCDQLGLLHVPIIDHNFRLKPDETIENLLSDASGRSTLNFGIEQEGMVFKEAGGEYSFKVISNKFLLENN